MEDLRAAEAEEGVGGAGAQEVERRERLRLVDIAR